MMKLKGGRELGTFLAQFEDKLQKKFLRNALRRGANVTRDKAREMAPKQSGKLAMSIKTDTRTNREQAIARVRLKGKHAFLGHFFEYGIEPHYIAVTGSKEGRVAVGKAASGDGTIKGGVMKIGDEFASGIVEHPGVEARPFLRPAFDATAKDAVNEVGKALHEFVQFGSLQAPLVEVDEDDE